MSVIKFLKPYVISQISAGEIIDRPSSVVKEIIENSLDAQSTIIEIDIENGGSKKIKIKDNGIGIKKKELLIATLPHTTSKIIDIKDLKKISSFGFRGEALSSIKSISKLKLTSKTNKQKNAWQIYTESSVLQFIKPIAHPIGTTLEVLDLFYNNPVKKKFIKSGITEFIHIEEIIKVFALSHFDLSITLKNNNKIVQKYLSCKKEDRITNILGDFFINKSLFISNKYENMNISGFISKPNNSKIYKKKQQYFYLNKRLINNKIIKHAIKQAYYDNNVNINNNPPSYLLYLTTNTEIIDINYHPSKKDIRLEKPRIIHDFIYQIIFNKLKKVFYLENKKISGINIFNIPLMKLKILKNEEKNIVNKKKIKCKLLKNCIDAYKKISFKIFGRLLTIIDNYALIQKNKDIFLMSMYKIKNFLLNKRCMLNENEVEYLENKKLFLNYSQAHFFLKKLELLYPELISKPPKNLIKKINIKKQIKLFKK